MASTADLVGLVNGTSTRLLRLQQLQIYVLTATLMVALWHVLCQCTIACLASLGAAKSSVKENARSSLLLLKHASCSTTGHITAWFRSPGGRDVLYKQRQCLPASGESSPICLSGSSLHSTSSSSGSSTGRLCRLPPQLPQHSGQLTVCLDLDETLLCTYRLHQSRDGLQLVPSNWTGGGSSSASRRRRSCTSALAVNSSSSIMSIPSRQKSISSGGSSGFKVSSSCAFEGELGMLGREMGVSCWMHYTAMQQCSTGGHSSSSTWGAGITTTLAVFERPGVRQFLAEVSQFAEVVLFTAASAAYAEPLVDLLDPQRAIFRARLYSDSCITACGREGVKDMQGVGRNMGRTVLVDNSPYSFLLQPANGLPCLPYHGDQADKQLLGVILPLLRSLSQLGDIRPLLDSKFRVREWLMSKGLDVPAEDEQGAGRASSG